MSKLPLFWIRTNNFGDALNAFLYRKLTGSEPVFSKKSPKILAVGSIAHMAYPGDVLWGTGVLSPSIPMHCNHTTRANLLRGPLTAFMLKKEGVEVNYKYGTPTYLLPEFVASAEKEHDIGIVVNYLDLDCPIVKEVQATEDVLFISAILQETREENFVEFIKKVTSCRLIASSSLHGLMVAETYGIPAVWVEFSDRMGGDGFKYRDYYMGSGRCSVNPLNWREEFSLKEAAEAGRRWTPPKIDLDLLRSTCPF